MYQITSISRFGTVLITALLTSSAGVSAEDYKVVYDFDQTNRNPENGLVKDRDGNFLGDATGQFLTTNIFKVTPSGIFSVLVQVTGIPGGGLTLDREGTIYGTTANYDDAGVISYTSSVFKFRSSGGLQTLYHFKDDYDRGGTAPYGRLAIDEKGQVFGTVSQAYPSYGLVFKIVDGTEQIMHGFRGQDGVFPRSSAIVLDASHNLYGTTYYGGTFDKGVVFKIAPDKTYTVLHSFRGVDGANPSYGVILDKDGNVYGNTYAGGSDDGGVISRSRRMEQRRRFILSKGSSAFIHSAL